MLHGDLLLATGSVALERLHLGCPQPFGLGPGWRSANTDQDEVQPPIILNGIEDVVSRPDLADRARFRMLPYLSEVRRQPEQQLWQDFELVRPRLLGALLDALSHGLRALPQVRPDRLPRMADFALWAAACETSLWPAATEMERRRVLIAARASQRPMVPARLCQAKLDHLNATIWRAGRVSRDDY
jgi:hypothetical protein